MALNIQKSYTKILNSVRSSNLNYSCQETPFSIYLTVRKSLVNKCMSIESGHQASEENLEITLSENILLKAELAEAKAELNISKNITSELEKKIAAAESEVCKVFRESNHWKEALTKKDDEITALKTSIKNSIGEKQQLSVDLQNQKKSLKLKDKEIHSLEIYKINHQETVKRGSLWTQKE